MFQINRRLEPTRKFNYTSFLFPQALSLSNFQLDLKYALTKECYQNVTKLTDVNMRNGISPNWNAIKCEQLVGTYITLICNIQ